MDLTYSFERVFPPPILERYAMRETRNAAAVLQSTHPHEFAEIAGVLSGFSLGRDDIVKGGGNKSLVAARLDSDFRELGWREGRYDTQILSRLTLMPYRAAGEARPEVRETEVLAEGYKVDNVKGGVALDVEWNAKDGNLDRDVGAYRALYDAGIIAVGVIVTRTTQDMRALGQRLGRDPFATTTTTNLEKLEPRMTRGDSGGCPLLAVAITARCFDEA